MKQNIMKRAISLLLALVCIMGVLPVSAFAAEGLSSAPDSITQRSSAYMTIGGRSVRYQAASSVINNVGLPYVFDEQVDVPGFGPTRALCAYQKGTLGPAANGQKWNFKEEVTHPSLVVILTYIYSHTYGNFTDAGNAVAALKWDSYWSSIWFMVAQAMSWYYEHGILIDVNTNREGFINQAAEEFVAAMKLYHDTYGQSSFITDWSLYEKRLATYPRTDSRYPTEDMADGLPDLCQTVAAALSFMEGQPLPVHAAQVVDSSKVSDHHAVIPTAEIAGADLAALPTGERNILYLIAVRLLCAVGEPHIYLETAATLECGGASFTAKGHIVTAEGWKGAERAFLSTLRQKPQQEAAPPLPALTEGQRLEGGDAALKIGTTSPPAHFNEDTLLSAMEHASAEDFAALETVERKGLGTPATRAGVIEKLVRSGFVERKGKQLIPTPKGTDLIRVMPDQLKSAKLTAEWEQRLGAVEHGELPPDAFVDGIVELVRGLVQTYAHVTVASAALSQSGRAVIGKCPRCGKSVVEGKKSFFCEGYYDKPPCGFALWKNDRFFTGKRKELTKKAAMSLLKNGRVAMTGLFSEKKGVFYDATVVLNDDGGKFVRFKLEFNNKKGGK